MYIINQDYWLVKIDRMEGEGGGYDVKVILYEIVNKTE